MMISTANFEDLERSLQKEWTVDQFDAVLQQFTEQVNYPPLKKDLFLLRVHGYMGNTFFCSKDH